MAYPIKASNDKLIKLYAVHGNVWKVAEEVGMCGQSVHERLTKLGIVNKMNVFTKEDDQKLIELYQQYVNVARLSELARIFGRTKQFICRQAKRLGLTDLSRVKSNFGTHEQRSCMAKDRIINHGHPRGHLGRVHSKETRNLLSKKSKDGHKRINDEGRRSDIVKRTMSKKLELYGTIAIPRSKTTWKGGWRTVGGIRKYFRSSWEANYARYLQSIIGNGEVVSWSYETKTFWFENNSDNILVYRPDFEVLLVNGQVEYHEVKGWYDKASITKLQKMKDEYPEVIVKVIDGHWFKSNRHLEEIEGWEKINKF